MRKLIKADENEKQLLQITKQKEELQFKINEENKEIKIIQQNIFDLEENVNKKFLKQEQEYVQQFHQESIKNNQLKQNLIELSQTSQMKLELTINYNQLNQFIGEVWTDLKEVDQKLIKFDEKVEKTTETIREVDTQQSTQTELQKQLLLLIEIQHKQVEQLTEQSDSKFNKQEQQLKSLQQLIQEGNAEQLQLKERLGELEDKNKQQIEQCNNNINKQSNQLTNMNMEIQENSKRSKASRDILISYARKKLLIGFNSDPDKQILTQIFLEQKFDQVL